LYKNLAVEIFTCEVCGFTQSESKMITFYGHEVIGAKMTQEIATRLRFNNKEIEKLTNLVRRHMFNYQPQMTDAAIRRLIRKIGKENISDMMLLRIADRKGSGSQTTSWRMMELQKRIGEQLFEPMEINDMVVNGRDVMEILGVKPGPIVGKVLKELFEEVLEDTSLNNKEYLTERIQKYKTDK
jgi:tRNA nucleotidyltransferase/poly(A) polymerase